MRKILHVLYLAHPGGGEFNTRALIELMNKKKFHISACFLHQHGPMVDTFKKCGIYTTVIGMKHGMDISGAFRFWNLLRKGKFDIVHIHLPVLITLAISYYTSPHVICHIRWGKAAQREGLRKKLLSYFFKRVDLIIPVCNAIKNVLIDKYGVPPNRIRTVYNGIDTKAFSREYDISGITAELGIEKASFITGFVGSLIPLKGCHKLLHAVQDIILADRTCYVLVVGDGPERPGLQKLAEELRIKDNVIFTGARDDIPRLFKLFDIFVLPSDIEAFPRTVEESLASGVPVIASNVGGIAEIIRDGIDGFLITTGIGSNLKEKILYLKNNESVRAAMARSAIERSKKFDIKQNSLQIKQIYTHILRSNAR